jgi:hypothetical protein
MRARRLLDWTLALATAALVGTVAPPRAVLADDPPPGMDAPPPKPPEGQPPGEEPTKPEPSPAPDFALKDLDGKERKLSEFAGKWVVLEWTNYGCPYVKKHYAPGPAGADGKPTPGNMPTLQKKYVGKGVVWLSICSSAPGKEGYIATAEEWKKAAAERFVASTAVLPDADGVVGHLYNARRTPEIRIVDPKGRLIYSGAIDDTKDPRADPTKAKNYVVQVLDAVLDGKDSPVTTTEPYG